MNKVKVTVTAILTLPAGVELIERFVDEGEDLGAHLKVGDKLYCPSMEWMIFEPRSTQSPEEQALGLGAGYSEVDDWLSELPFADGECPIIYHTIESKEE